MKRIIYVLICLTGLFNLMSCHKTTPENETTEVSISFDYSIVSSGDMTKGSSSDVFNKFYEKIVSGEFAAENYSLTLKSITSNAEYKFNGTWNDSQYHTLKTGTYVVTGKAMAYGDYIQDKCSFSFDQTVEITPYTTVVSLTALYESFLVIFNSDNLQSLYNYSGNSETSFFDFENFKYGFVNNKLYADGCQNEAGFTGTYADGTYFDIKHGKINYEKGKYYIYSNIRLDFDIPYMEEGDEYQSSTNYEAVDLGLSVKWAAYNVGATKPEEIGGRYAWGETVVKEYYDWDNYMWCDGEEWLQNKYCLYPEVGTVDGKLKLDDEDDVAMKLWGNGWRMPTLEEAYELCDNTTWEYTVLNDTEGYTVTGPNGNSIFVPSCGQLDENGLSVEDQAILWTSETDGSQVAYNINCGHVALFNHKHDGVCVRAVIEY